MKDFIFFNGPKRKSKWDENRIKNPYYLLGDEKYDTDDDDNIRSDFNESAIEYLPPDIDYDELRRQITEQYQQDQQRLEDGDINEDEQVDPDLDENPCQLPKNILENLDPMVIDPSSGLLEDELYSEDLELENEQNSPKEFNPLDKPLDPIWTDEAPHRDYYDMGNPGKHGGKLEDSQTFSLPEDDTRKVTINEEANTTKVFGEVEDAFEIPDQIMEDD